MISLIESKKPLCKTGFQVNILYQFVFLQIRFFVFEERYCCLCYENGEKPEVKFNAFLWFQCNLIKYKFFFYSKFCPAGCRDIAGDISGNMKDGYRDVSD